MNHKESIVDLFILPSQNKNNRYIELLLGSIDKSLFRVQSGNNDNLLNIFMAILTHGPSCTDRIIHIQWSTVLYGSKYILKSLLLLVFNFSSLLLLKVFFRTRVVWTMHNSSAHDYPHPFIDYLGRILLSKISDAIIVHEQSTFIKLKENGLNKVRYIPHGNYIGAYGEIVEKDLNLRRSLGFQDTDIVLLSFGVIAPYKRNEKLIDVMKDLSDTHPNIKLLICGKGHFSYVKKIEDYAGNHHAIVIKNKFILDQDVPNYFSIADYSVFYYDDSEMTSGGIILSLSYGVPIITRNIPASEAISDVNGKVFKNNQDLIQILKGIIDRPRYDKLNIVETVKGNSWSKVERELTAVYKDLL